MAPKMKPILLKGMQVYSEGEIILNGYIKILNEKIVELGSTDKLGHEAEYETFQLPASYKAIPGFIDVHIHGVAGADTMDATKEALEIMTAALPHEGTTSFLATTITQETTKIEAALRNAGHFIAEFQAPGKAEILGVHLEGPFINAKRAGAQPIQHIIAPDLEAFKKWYALSMGTIKLVTLAPERPGGFEMIQSLKDHGIIASIGHSDATYEETIRAIGAGVNHITHLFNQMRGMHHREPGVAGAALLHNEVKAEIIVDGIHIRPEMVKLAFELKKKEGLLLITDSLRAKCLMNGQYDLGGQKVTVKDGKAVLMNGTLAGSTLKMNQAVKNMLRYASCSLTDAIEMASVNPAKQLHIYDRKGSILVGKDADIVILNENLEVFMTFCRGRAAFKQK